MYTRRSSIWRTCLDILAVICCLALLGVFLSSVQGSLSVNRQRANSLTKLFIARERLEDNCDEALTNMSTYDAFNQAKADTTRWFLDNAQPGTTLSQIMTQFGLMGISLLDADYNVIESVGEAPDMEQFKSSFQDDEPAGVDAQRWYISRRENGTSLIVGDDFSGEREKLNTLLSHAYALDSITVGTSGYIAAIQNGEFSYHPNESMIGRKVSDTLLGSTKLEDDFSGWVKTELGRSYCDALQVGDTLLVAIVPQAELKDVDRDLVLISLIVFASVLSLLVAYAVILRRSRKRRLDGAADEYDQLGKKLYINATLLKKLLPVTGAMLVVIFILTYYMQTLALISRQVDINYAKLESVETLLDHNDQRVKEMREEYTEIYSHRAQNIAWLLERDPSLVNDEKLEQLAEMAQIHAIYVFDQYGRTTATNTVYKDFSISRDEAAQSYEFWDVIKGYKDVLSQEAREDDTSEHALMQYVGVKRLDAQGMVQIGVLPKRLKNRLATTELHYVLSNTAVENAGFLFAVDGETHALLSFPMDKYIDKPAEDYGLRLSAFRDDAIGFQRLDGDEFFVTCAEHDKTLVFVAVPTESIYLSRLPMSRRP